MSYDNTNRGTLGKAKNRPQDNSPEYTGKINVDGKDYWLSGWVKTGTDGSRFFSLAVKRKDAPATQKPKAFEDDFNDPIPF